MWTAELPYGFDYFALKFKCVLCDEDITSDTVSVPDANYSAEFSDDSAETEESSFECPKCHKVYNITVCSTFGGSNIEIDELPLSHIVGFEGDIDQLELQYDINELSARNSNSNFLQTFQNDIAELKQLAGITLKDWQIRETHNRHLFVAVISSMEVFLSDILLNLVMQKRKYLKGFVKTYKRFEKRQMLLTDLFEEYSNIKHTVTQEILDIRFHNLATVKNIFHDTFSIEFPSIQEPMKLIIIRHDLVHRNGKTKDNDAITIDDNILNHAFDVVEEFVLDVAEKMKDK